jgi:hypothetical protein
LNKYVVYSVIAILLGTITITVPITLFNIKENQNTPYDRNNGNGFLPEGADNSLAPTTTEEDLVISPISSLKSIGLMIVPSFLVALGIFVLIRKKIG